MNKNNVLTIIDQKPIPNLGLDSPPSFEIFGYNMSGSSNFVTDFSFETNITPDLASQISIGATAQGSSTRNTDATAFSKWNRGLVDRFSLKIEEKKPEFETATAQRQHQQR